jgi:CubicO group peptidase (beta-lactamase class C family)
MNFSSAYNYCSKLRACRLSNTFWPVLSVAIAVLLTICPADLYAEDGNRRPFGRFDEFRDQLLQKMVETRTPSMAIAVSRNGQIVWEEGFGLADREDSIPATPETVYSLASVTKPMTATAIMRLIEQNQLELDAPVNSYLRDCPIRTNFGNEAAITVTRILHHTAGLPTIWNFYYEGALIQRPDIIESIKQYGFTATPPGTRYEYSNLGYGILEHLIEVISGMSYAEFMRSEVFEPLGMPSAFIVASNSDLAGVAPRYLENKNQSPHYQTMSRGGGGACSNVHDLLRFGMFHLKDHLTDQKEILSDQMIELMQTNSDGTVVGSSYKLGWETRFKSGYMIVQHGGGMPGVSSALLLVPEEDMAIAILSNGTYIDLFRIGDLILTLSLPAKPTARVNSKNDGVEHSTGTSVLGQWQGFIHTQNDSVLIRLDIDQSGDVILMEGSSSELFHPLFDPEIGDGKIRATFDLQLPFTETSRCRSKAHFKLMTRDDRLVGYVGVESHRLEVFYLPYMVTLERQRSSATDP